MKLTNADELRLYAENTGSLYSDVRKAVRLLAECRGAGSAEDPIPCSKCLDVWIALCARAASQYRREIGSSEYRFNSDVIRLTARDWALDYLLRLRGGEQGLYD